MNVPYFQHTQLKRDPKNKAAHNKHSQEITLSRLESGAKYNVNVFKDIHDCCSTIEQSQLIWEKSMFLEVPTINFQVQKSTLL